MIPPERFTGTVQRLGPVDCAAVAGWVMSIPFEEWPQQSRLADGRLRPAMVNDPHWHGFAGVVAPVEREILAWAPGGRVLARLLTVVMPGHNIPPHVDQQAPAWWTRVHVPLVSNDASVFLVGGRPHHLDVGVAYMVNTETLHAVRNDGDTPRVHLMLDVGAPA